MKYNLTVTISAEKLPTVIDLLAREADVFSVLPVTEPAPQKPSSKGTGQTFTQVHHKSVQAVKDALPNSGTVFTAGHPALVASMAEHGYAAGSIGPALVALERANFIKRVGRGRYVKAEGLP